MKSWIDGKGQTKHTPQIIATAGGQYHKIQRKVNMQNDQRSACLFQHESSHP